MAYYRVCPGCGAYLDPGELCDCRQNKKEEAVPLARKQPQASTPVHNLPVIEHYVKNGGGKA